jgi:SAM-dependent methyltransferase
MDTGSGPGAPPSREADELARIRSVYRERDRRGWRSGPFQEAYHRLRMERIAATRTVLTRLMSEQHPRLIDVGCGTGGDLAYLRSTGWPADRLAGVDLIPSRLGAARLACPDVELRLGDGTSVPFPDNSVDVATAVTVFSSILDLRVRRALFAEMQRVVRPGGVVLLYDFVIRKPTNPNVIGMPLQRLTELGRPPDWSMRLSPVLQAVAVGAAVHPRLADLAMRLAPRTHRLSGWRKPALEGSADWPGW